MKTLIYEGKAKNIYQGEKDHEVIMYFKDDITALNGLRKDGLLNKGILNNKISTILYNYLKNKGIKTHHLLTIDERHQKCTKVKIIPLEYIIRNYSAGSMAKRLGLAEGLKLAVPVKEICYKDDALNDPLINEDHAYALGIITKEQMSYTFNQLMKINQLLVTLFHKIDLILVDFKIEFGIDQVGNIVLADELSPDCMRLWDVKTLEKMDKDRYRQSLGNILEGYQIILNKLEGVDISE